MVCFRLHSTEPSSDADDEENENDETNAGAELIYILPVANRRRFDGHHKDGRGIERRRRRSKLDIDRRA